MQVLTVTIVMMWLVIAAGTIRGVISGKMFFAPCLGTDLYAKRKKTEQQPDAKLAKEEREV